MFTGLRLSLALATALTIVSPAIAQPGPPGPPEGGPHVEFFGGHAGFVDDATIHNTVFGGAARFPVTTRLSVGPEVAYMWGPNGQRNMVATGNLTFDLLHPRGGRPPRVSPFLVAGGGLFMHEDVFTSGTFRSWEGAFTLGGGSKFWFNDRAYAVADFRVEWELHTRITGGMGFAL
jgi:hypothetical protein